MAFPTVVARTTSQQTSDATAWSPSLGSPSAGDLVLAILAVDGALSSDQPFTVDTDASGFGWHKVIQANGAANGVAAFWKIAAGGDVLRVHHATIGAGPGEQGSAVVYRMTGAAAVAAASTTGSSTNADPPNLGISGAAQDALWIAACVHDGAMTASAAPASYTNLTTIAAGSGGNASINSAERQVNGTSENPGAFTTTNAAWIGLTFAVMSVSVTTTARATQEAVETLSQVSPNLVATQVAVEALSSNLLDMIVTQVAVELLSENVPDDAVGGDAAMIGFLF